MTKHCSVAIACMVWCYTQFMRCTSRRLFGIPSPGQSTGDEAPAAKHRIATPSPRADLLPLQLPRAPAVQMC